MALIKVYPFEMHVNSKTELRNVHALCCLLWNADIWHTQSMHYEEVLGTESLWE